MSWAALPSYASALDLQTASRSLRCASAVFAPPPLMPPHTLPLSDPLCINIETIYIYYNKNIYIVYIIIYIHNFSLFCSCSSLWQLRADLFSLSFSLYFVCLNFSLFSPCVWSLSRRKDLFWEIWGLCRWQSWIFTDFSI